MDNNPYVYVEKVYENTLLVDFLDSGAYNIFLESTQPISDGKTFSDPSMILIQNYNQKKVREGVTYPLNINTIKTILNENRIALYQQDSLIIGFHIDLKQDDDDLFGKSKSFDDIERFHLNMDRWPDNGIPEFKASGDIKVLVRNVGQGSWNEIVINNRTELIFDIGTHYLTRRTDIQKMLEDKEDIFITDNPGIIISHWDIDHYHYLIGLSDKVLKSIRFFCARNYLPTLTSRIIYSRIEQLIGSPKMYPIAPLPRPDNKLTYAQLKKIDPSASNIICYNSTDHRNRNQNAICLAIRKPNTSIVLPADTHYEQIANCILPDLGYKNNHYLVVPHHGGKAGKFKYNLTNLVTPKTAIVSVGKNSYGHPKHKNLQDLSDMGFKILQTNIHNKDIEITLT